MTLFSRLKSSKAKNPSDDSRRKTSAAVQARIKNILGLKQLSPLPANAMQAFELSSDPSASISDFVQVIESDEALSSRVVRVANSVYFSRGTPASNIDAAVANIGLDELRCLLSASLIKNLLKGQDTFREQLWTNAVATAVFAKGLSRYLPNIASSEAFLCGLVHDVGKLVMTRETDELYKKVNSLVSDGEMDFVEAEERIFELNHVEVGAWVAEAWNFPELVLDSISEHHRPFPEQADKVTAPMLVKIADSVAHAEGLGHPRGMSGFQQAARANLQCCWALIGISDEDGKRFIKDYRREFEESLSLYETA